MVICNVCKNEFQPVKSLHYIARDDKEQGIATAIKASQEPILYDAFSCPICGSQYIAQEFKRVDENNTRIQKEHSKFETCLVYPSIETETIGGTEFIDADSDGDVDKSYDFMKDLGEMVARSAEIPPELIDIKLKPVEVVGSDNEKNGLVSEEEIDESTKEVTDFTQIASKIIEEIKENIVFRDDIPPEMIETPDKDNEDEVTVRLRSKYSDTTPVEMLLYGTWSEVRLRELLTKKQLTEKEFLGIVDAGIQSELSIGTEITLSNPLGTTNIWVVAGVNHDDTVGTVDLISKNLIQDSTDDAYGGKFGVSQNYFWSKLYKWLNNVFINGFSIAIQNSLKTMNVKTDIDGSIESTQDKIKLLSMNELGLTNSDWKYVPNTAEGTMYPIFESGNSDSAKAKRKKYKSDGGTGWYWTRSRIVGGSNYVCCADSNGSYSFSYYTNATGGVVAAIRF